MDECCPVAVLVEEPPAFDFRGGMFFVFDRKTGIHRAYPPSVFFRTFAAMGEAARKYRIEGAEIIQFPGSQQAIDGHEGVGGH